MTERNELLELYRVMVDTVTANEQRRQQISSVFITLVAAGFGAVGAIEDFQLVYATVPAVFLSIIWWAQVRYLKNLASAKFHVICQIEDQFVYQPFKEEWKHLKRDAASSRSWLRLGLSQIEMLVPIGVFFASFAHVGYTVFQKLP